MILHRIMHKQQQQQKQALQRSIKTFALQEKLPRLPIPKLEDTVRKYVKSVEPLTTAPELAQVRLKSQSFLEKEGPVLQQRLEEYGKRQKDNWLEDLWLHKAYLEWREPVMNNVNWYMLFKDSDRYSNSSKRIIPSLPFTNIQLERASFLIRGALEYNRLLEEELLKPEETKFGPLCMHQNKRLFGITRIPSFPFDKLAERPESKHIIVLLKEQVFHVQVRNERGDILDEEGIKRSLEECVRLVQKIEPSPPVCSFTTENRDVWAAMREKIISTFPRENGESFEKVNDSLFAVSLEDCDASNIDESAKVSLHGFAGRNRWFDKCINLWVCPSGKAGGNGEHSPCDAVIPNQMAQFVLEAEASKVLFPEKTISSSNFAVEHLEFKVTPEVMEALMGARISASKSCEAIDLLETRFKEFGAEGIRTKCGVGPDGFFQAAMQLAYYGLNRKMTATYETASTRKFLHGRTETIRACTPEALPMCQAFFDKKDVSLLKKVDLVKAYLESHKQYLIQASNGEGVDRHLLGLRCMVREGEEMPALFDSIYWRSLSFDLSTSNVSPGEVYDGLGFGPATASGYGINYSLAPTSIRFSVCSRKGPERKYDSKTMRDAIVKAMKELFTLLSVKSKM